MQQVVHEVTSQAALLYWMQWYTNSLLDFEDESLSRLCPRVVLLRGVRPEILRRQEPGSTQLTNHRSLHRRSRWVDVLCSTILLGLEAHKMWNLWRGNIFSWCVRGLLLNKIQALADMNTLGSFSLDVAQEEGDDLNLLRTH